MGWSNRYFNLVREMAVTDFKLRYNSSVLGYLWSLLNPLLIFGVLYIVFSVFVRWDAPYYSLYLLLGIILWTFFAETTSKSMLAMLNKKSLITKINFPKNIIIISLMLANFITIILNLGVFFIFFAFTSAKLGMTILILPFYIIELLLLSTGVSFFLSALFVKFKDIKHLWDVFLQIGFWITPIVYPISFVPGKLVPFIFLNPMARIIQDSRGAIINHTLPSLSQHIATFAAILIVLIMGYIVFRRLEPKMAEQI